MYDVDPLGLLTRELLRARAGELIADACAWSVGLSDQPHYRRRHGRITPSGMTLGVRAESGLPLGGAEDERLELGDARPGSFQDALNALTPTGRLHADRFEEELLTPFVLQTCVRAAEQARVSEPTAWQELLDELGEDESDLVEVVRAAEWEAPLKTEAELLVLAALGAAPLVEVEAEGLPLSLVQAAEAETRRAAVPGEPDRTVSDEELAGSLFLADAALREAGLERPVPAAKAEALLEALTTYGLEEQDVLEVLPHLPVQEDAAEQVRARIEKALREQGRDGG